MTDPITGATTIEEDPISGELYITFPDEVAKAAGMDGWEYVNWDLNTDGTVTITRADPPGGDEADHF
ncbi:MAG: hypothetical protein FJ275_01170 [Planctomycetes bacterium]|nr:hypothetical protein [Planctomycetota bacterium]